MKILLADDTEINRLYLSEALAGQGATVQTAVDGLDALQRARAEHFDLLVLDIRMPQYFGDEVLRLLRDTADAASRSTPAIAISSEMDAALATRLCAEGFVAALAKPVQAAALLLAAGVEPAPVKPVQAGAGAQVDQLDDAQALRALGNADIVARLRQMLAIELRTRLPDLLRGAASRDAAAVREWIHQMRASCALCGAARLDYTLLALRAQVIAANWPGVATALQEVQAVVAALLPVLDPQWNAATL